MRTDGMLKDDALKGQTIIVTGGGTALDVLWANTFWS